MDEITHLQELYLHLDHQVDGDKYMAWYGQLRAMGYNHEEAIYHTVEYWKLQEKAWYQRRMMRYQIDMEKIAGRVNGNEQGESHG